MPIDSTPYARLVRSTKQRMPVTPKNAMGAYADEIDWAAEDLAEMRDAYAATLDEETDEQYARAFSKAVHKAFPEIAVILDTL